MEKGFNKEGWKDWSSLEEAEFKEKLAQLSFEEGMALLSCFSSSMEGSDLSLEETMALYERSQWIGEALHRQLDEAELLVQNLQGEDISLSSLRAEESHD